MPRLLLGPGITALAWLGYPLIPAKIENCLFGVARLLDHCFSLGDAWLVVLYHVQGCLQLMLSISFTTAEKVNEQAFAVDI